MKKNQTGEAQCCWKAHTSVSWSACQPSAHEVLGLIRLMHLLMGLTRLFNESVTSLTCFNILTGTTLHKAGRGRVGISSSSSRGRGHQKHWKEYHEHCVSLVMGTVHPPPSTLMLLKPSRKSLFGEQFCAPGKKSLPALCFSKTPQSLVEGRWSDNKIAMSDRILPTQLQMVYWPLASSLYHTDVLSVSWNRHTPSCLQAFGNAVLCQLYTAA